MKRHGIRREEHRHGPSAVTRQRLYRLHVNRIQVRTLLAINLDVHEQFVHERRGCLILEGLVRHDVAPVARRVTDAQQDRLPFPLRELERVRPPLVPVDRVVGMLLEVRTRGIAEAVGHGSR